LLTLKSIFCIAALAILTAIPAVAQEASEIFVTRSSVYPGPVAIVLQVPAGTTVHYSLDGSVPTQDADVYTGPIPVRRTTVVRARAFGANGAGGPVGTGTFLVGTGHTLPVVSLVTEAANLWDPKRGIYVMGTRASTAYPHRGANFWQDWERPVHVEFFEPDGRRGFAQDMGMKIHGGHSRGSPQKSLALFARSRYGKGTLAYPVFPGLGVDRFEALVLRNAGNDWGLTMMRDALVTRLGGALGLDVQAYRPAVVYLNGAYWGIHNIREKINEHYLASHHAVDPDGVELLETGGTAVIGDERHYRAMVAFAKWNPLSKPANYAYIRSQMDVENFRDYQIVQIYAGNTDWPGGNIKFWRSQRPGSRWRWLLFDVDFGFGSLIDRTYTHNTLAFAAADDGPAYPNPPWATQLLRSLLENPAFRTDFINRCADLLNTALSTGQVVAVIDSMQAAIAPDMSSHTARWGGSRESWIRAVQRLRVFARNRPFFVRRHLAQHFGLGSQVRLAVAVSPPEGGWVRVNSVATRSSWAGYYLSDVPLHLVAVPAKGYRFVGWSGVETSTPAAYRIQSVLRRNTILSAKFVADKAVPASVVINEINYHSAASFDPGDWVEIYNRGTAPVDLGGWSLADQSGKEVFRLAEGTVLLPRSYLVLCRDQIAFAAHFPRLGPCRGDWDFGLGGGGDSIVLADGDGRLVDGVRYSDRAPWPSGPDGSGATLALASPHLDNGRAENWTALCCHGTPGAPNGASGRSAFKAADVQAIRADVAVLEPNFPNPFNSVTQIRFWLPRRQKVRLSVYDVLGRQVAVPVAAELAPGDHSVALDADGWASGLYFLRLRTVDGELKSRMVLLR
jgi:hypothetical protein